jgi:hypothetical protein
MPQAIPLISYDDDASRFFIPPQAQQLLNGLRGAVSIVTMCGRARQGKSSLLNQMVSSLGNQTVTNSNGFKVGAGSLWRSCAPARRRTVHALPQVSAAHHSCTKGLWVWDTPLVQRDAAGQHYSLLLVDCEGVDAFDQGDQHSAKIFSLAVLMSSLFVYNQARA